MSDSIYKNGSYLDERPGWHVEHSPWKANNILRILEKNKINPKTICDLGCGSGEILNQLHQKMGTGCVFSGYDISPQALQLAKEREKERLHFFQEDLISDGKNNFDLVLAIDLIEHIEDIFKFLRSLRALGEYKIFHIPLDLSVLSTLRVSPFLLSRKQVGHIHYFNKELALSILEETGYEILDYFYTKGSIELPRNTKKSWLMKWPRYLFDKINPGLCSRLLGGYSLMVLSK